MSDNPKNSLRIILRHKSDPTGKFAPQTKQCADYVDKRTGVQHKGCGATIRRFLSWKENGVYFDGEPIVFAGTEKDRGDGAIVAFVSNANVHRATCPYAQQQARVTDGKAAAAGAESR